MQIIWACLLLYQLRGRVGRSNRIAYAYLMYHPDKVLTEVSEKRLDAIKGFTELGSGFKIAMRDLSIRGAGNILGASQSGFIDSVGFEMYSQLLEEAINKRQGKTQVRRKFAVKEMQSSISRLMLTSLLTIFLTSAKKLKFISVFEKLRIRKTTKTFKMSLLTALENIQTKLPISLRLVWLRPIWMLPLQN